MWPPPKNLFRVWWSTEATNLEYSVPQSAADCDDPATPAEQCVHTIRSAFQGRGMVVNPGSTNNACMVTNDPNACGDEKRIAASGGGGAAADGLRPPPRVRLDGNYTSIKRVNSTHGHWGVMALWQMRGAYAD